MNYVTVTAPTIEAFNAQVAALQAKVYTAGGLTALGFLQTVNGQYQQTFVNAVPVERYPLLYRPPISLWNQPGYL